MNGAESPTGSALTDAERRFLAHPPRSLARIATVDAEGMPHVVPGQWAYDASSHELVLGGNDVPNTRRARHVRATGVASAVVDGQAPGPGWSPWALVVRGRARVIDHEGVIRVSCDEILSWGLDEMVAESHAAATEM